MKTKTTLAFSIFCTYLFFLIPNTSGLAQPIFEQLKGQPWIVNGAEVFQNKLFVRTNRGLYTTPIDSIKWTTHNPTRNVTEVLAVEDQLFYSSLFNTFLGTNYCGDPAGYRGVALSQSPDGSNFQTILNKSESYYSGQSSSLIDFAALPIQVLDDSIIYAPIFKIISGSGGDNYIGKVKVISTSGNINTTINHNMRYFTSDGNYFYSVFQNELYKSQSPSFSSFETIPIENISTNINTIDKNKRLYAFNDTLYLFHHNKILKSSDEGTSWEVFANPHNSLTLFDAKDGIFYYKYNDKIHYSTSDPLSPVLEVQHDFSGDPFLADKTLHYIDDTYLIASKLNELYLSSDFGLTWNLINTGYWFSDNKFIAVTDSSYFIESFNKRFRTTDNGITFQAIDDQNFTLNINNSFDTLHYDEYQGFKNSLFLLGGLDSTEHRIYTSQNYGDNWSLYFNEELEGYFLKGDLSLGYRDSLIFFSLNNGSSWIEKNIANLLTDTSGNLQKIANVEQDSNVILLQLENFSYLVSHDFGQNFSDLALPDSDLELLIKTNKGHLYAVNDEGVFWIKLDAMDNWVQTSNQLLIFEDASFRAINHLSVFDDVIIAYVKNAGVNPQTCNLDLYTQYFYSENFGIDWFTLQIPFKTNLQISHGNNLYFGNRGLFGLKTDSLNLDNEPIDFSIENEMTLCFGENYNDVVFYNDTTLIDTSYSNDLNIINITNIFITPPATGYLNRTLCPGETITYNNLEYTTAGNYLVDSLQSNITGCDSLLYLVITDGESYLDSIILELEAGDVYNNIEIYSDTLIIDNFTASNGCDSIVTTIINVQSVGIQQINDSNQFKIAPNPFEKSFVIQSIDGRIPQQVKILDINGRVFYQNNNVEMTNAQMNIDLGHLASGVYVVLLENGQDTFVERLVKF